MYMQCKYHNLSFDAAKSRYRRLILFMNPPPPPPPSILYEYVLGWMEKAANVFQVISWTFLLCLPLPSVLLLLYQRETLSLNFSAVHNCILNGDSSTVTDWHGTQVKERGRAVLNGENEREGERNAE